MKTCRLCGTDSASTLIDCGPQPICNRYLSGTNQEEYTHPMVIGQCGMCGLLQMSDPVPASEILPRHDWITYVEPERHLDTLADVISALPGLSDSSTICGISYKDDSIVARLNKKGFQNTHRLALLQDFGITELGSGDETLQDRIKPDVTAQIAQHRGKFDVLIIRHIFEHAHEPIAFLIALKKLLKPNGYLVLEVPDTVRPLEQNDYSFLWEEHVLYFTPETFKNILSMGGFSLIQCREFFYHDENIIAGIAQSNDQVVSEPPSETALDAELKRARNCADRLTTQRTKVREFLSNFRNTNGGIAMYGAGHRSITYVNLFGLQDYVDFAADDDPHKIGLLMPGSQLPIHDAGILTSQNIKLCLLAVKAEYEDQILKKNQAFINQGGIFASILPSSRLALEI